MSRLLEVTQSPCPDDADEINLHIVESIHGQWKLAFSAVPANLYRTTDYLASIALYCGLQFDVYIGLYIQLSFILL